MFKDYYLILGISKDATSEEIDKAYKDAQSSMDDKTSSAYYQEVQEAFTILSDQETKQLYDNELSSFIRSEGFANHVIIDKKLAQVMNSLQGLTEENENNQNNAYEIIVDDKKQKAEKNTFKQKGDSTISKERGQDVSSKNNSKIASGCIWTFVLIVIFMLSTCFRMIMRQRNHKVRNSYSYIIFPKANKSCLQIITN